ncbi:unnamed protein product, partial [Meganyctiphanes norvegica]
MLTLLLFQAILTCSCYCPAPFQQIGADENCCYYFSTMGLQVTWPEAREYCHGLGEVIMSDTVDMAEVDTSNSCNSDDLMDTMKSKYLGTPFWLGGRDDITEGTWEWQHSTGETLSLNSSRWGNAYPIGSPDRNCLHAVGYYEDDTAYLYDDYCEDFNWFICQIFNSTVV